MINQTMYELGSVRSGIRELFEYGLKQKAVVGEENVFDYSLGNPSVPAPAVINQTISNLVEHENSLKLHGYTSATGYNEIKEAVAAELSERYHVQLRPQNFFFVSGCALGLVSVFRALSVKNAEIIAILPCFPEYRVFLESNGVKFISVPADEEHFQIRLAELEAKINQNTQAVIINSPNNPSGAVYTRDTLQELACILKHKSAEVGHPIYIISDEPYRELVYDGREVPFIPEIYPDTVICYSYSKSLSLPGERIGYVLVPDSCSDSQALYNAVAGAARASGHVCAPSLLQHVIAKCAAQKPDLEVYDRNRNLLYNELTAYGYQCVKPEGAFYLFVKAPNGNSVAFSELAKKHNLLLVPGTGFGCPNYFRLCTAVSTEMIKRSLPVFKKLLTEI